MIYDLEIDALPNKLPRPAPSSHLHVENGRTLGSCHVAAGYSSIKLGTTKYINAERVLETKERKTNGTEGPPPSTDDLRPLVALESSPNGKASVKPPHPDTKFLSQIYSVPKMEEWPEYDNQYWLFSSNFPGPKPRATLEAEETSHVWAKGLQIESADVFALPFVIPY
ncbi:putative RNA-binding protein 25-like [Cocos nucifera]|uniref:Putative RNA-binding protein 25-like n=1 Tax=Cocos nucifera TaxID=13894 RepID=A0A8K0I0G8_COCNU|nr:putative RNA-binding protein 25-like [Cocos nucifera]